ncbi:DUF4253 domain-containing protein [Streptomyces blattellae]|uniref:DUF4253 domain-containing protein n=1 Tax=Streptomyces blattellae TaxID=2569855 RepID=UPI0012B7D74B|nr:DUF4253 domain-containing protein [Streptomyces blattellae]
MATLPNPLPTLTADPSGRALGLTLPPGRLIDATDEGPWHEPLLWHAETPASVGVWTKLGAPAARTGLLPVLIETGGSQSGPEDWELMPGEASYPGDHDADEVLEELWEDCEGEDGEEWPGLAEAPYPSADSPDPSAPTPDPDSTAAEIADSLLLAGGGPFKDPHLALVPARRSADIPAAIGWSGPANHENDVARLCAVLRSWEDRFGIRVVALGFDHLLVSVAAPPSTQTDAEALAAEHFAFCPDNIWQSSDTTLRAYAEHRLLNQPAWHFWWD